MKSLLFVFVLLFGFSAAAEASDLSRFFRSQRRHSSFHYRQQQEHHDFHRYQRRRFYRYYNPRYDYGYRTPPRYDCR